jgi:type IV pilus assembly protein PilA
MTPSVQPLQPPPKKKFPVWLIVVLATAGAFCLIVPVLAVLGIYGTRKYLANAKTAEARNALGQIAKDAAMAYEAGDETLAPSNPAAGHGKSAHRLCPTASAPVPASIALVRGRKYQSSPSDWEADKATNAGFYCLKFSMDMPQYYQYSYTSRGVASPGDGFAGTAHGDLNGDGVTSEFTIMGQIGPGGALSIAPNLLEKDPEE